MTITMWTIIGLVAWFVIFATTIMVVHCGNKKPWPERVERFRE